MLNERTSALLQYLNENCKEGGYTIFTEDDFRERLGEEKEGERFDETLSFLQDEGYIAVKYACEGTYCVRPSLRGAEYSRRKEEREREEKTHWGDLSRDLSRNLLQSNFFGGFLGGVAGGILSATITLLISLFFR